VGAAAVWRVSSAVAVPCIGAWWPVAMALGGGAGLRVKMTTLEWPGGPMVAVQVRSPDLVGGEGLFWVPRSSTGKIPGRHATEKMASLRAAGFSFGSQSQRWRWCCLGSGDEGRWSSQSFPCSYLYFSFFRGVFCYFSEPRVFSRPFS
jgi:hypothetical protein